MQRLLKKSATASGSDDQALSSQRLTLLTESKLNQENYAKLNNESKSVFEIEDLQTMDIPSIPISTFVTINQKDFDEILNRMKGLKLLRRNSKIFIKFGLIYHVTDSDVLHHHYFVKFFKDTEELSLTVSFGKTYDNWENFMDTADFSSGMICVPISGEYEFKGGKLNLEFINVKKKDLPQTLVTHKDGLMKVIYSIIDNKDFLMEVIDAILSCIPVGGNLSAVVDKLKKAFGIEGDDYIPLILAAFFPPYNHLIVIFYILLKICIIYGKKYLQSEQFMQKLNLSIKCNNLKSLINKDKFDKFLLQVKERSSLINHLGTQKKILIYN